MIISTMIHSKMVQPRIFPWNSARTPEQINRLQEISDDLALNRDPMYEIGREAVLDYHKKTPTLTGRYRQFEYGSMEFFYALANKVTPGSGEDKYITLDDLKNTYSDISMYLTDASNNFQGSGLIPKTRLSGFSINIGDPEAIVERNFNFVGEAFRILPNNYYAYAEKTTGVHSGYDVDTIVLTGSGNPPEPVEYATGQYIFRVLRVRGVAVDELLEDETLSPAVDTWGYDNGTKTVTIQTTLTGDIYKVYYEAASAYATLWTNDDETSALFAEYAEIRLKFTTANRIYTLQTIGMDVAFERQDNKGIGSNEVIQTSVKNTTVKISLNRFTEGFSLEDILAGGTAFPYLNPEDFVDDIQVQVKLYADKEHQTFKIGYLGNKITPTTIGMTQLVNDFNKITNALQGDNLKISTVESEIAFA